MHKVLEPNIEIQMAESHLFLYLADQRIDESEAQVCLKETGDEFHGRYESIIPAQRCLIYNYAVHPEGALNDLRNIDVQLGREWVAIVSLGVKYSAESAQRCWLLDFTPSYYQGYTQYAIPFSADSIQKTMYNSQGLPVQTQQPEAQESNAACQLVTRVLKRQETVQRAEQLLHANSGFVKMLGALMLEIKESGIQTKEDEKEMKKLREVIKLIKFR